MSVPNSIAHARERWAPARSPRMARSSLAELAIRPHRSLRQFHWEQSVRLGSAAGRCGTWVLLADRLYRTFDRNCLALNESYAHLSGERRRRNALNGGRWIGVVSHEATGRCRRDAARGDATRGARGDYAMDCREVQSEAQCATLPLDRSVRHTPATRGRLPRLGSLVVMREAKLASGPSARIAFWEHPSLMRHRGNLVVPRCLRRPCLANLWRGCLT